jgi:hypothetical protein
VFYVFLASGDVPNVQTLLWTISTYVSMKEGLVSNVPISITPSDNGNISIMVDPKTTNNHFGNTPNEGKVTV